jgi:hypothetical protein
MPLSATHAQTTTAQPNVCRQLLFQNVLPILSQANRFNPGGVFPVGWAPLAQPFATNPSEFSIYGYPYDAYYKGYQAPSYSNSTAPWLGSTTGYPPPSRISGGAVPTYAMPPAGMMPGMPGQDMAMMPPPPPSPSPPPPPPPPPSPTPSAELNSEFSSSAIWSTLRSSGAWDRLTPTEQADWMFRLAQLQNQELSQRLQQTQLNQSAEVSYQNTRRVPYDLSTSYQDRSRNWRDSYSLYAQTMMNFIQNACDPSTGIGNATLTNSFVQCIGPGNPFSFCTGIGR